VHVALLRGVNVGGKNKLPMKELAAIFAAVGCGSVTTYIQSGNVVFDAGRCDVAKLAELVSKRVKKQFGFDSPIVLRTAQELDVVARKNPFLATAPTESALHVVFLASAPDARAVKALDPQRSPGDTFEVRGREIYLCCPNGLGRTKLSNAWFDSKLATTSTVRNWRTVLELRDLSGAS